MDSLNYNKEIISKIAGIDDWKEFETFIKDLYDQNDGVIHVERSYKSKGKSGRNREVDVFVRLGFKPHEITLGVECKYWKNKIDGDIIDVAASKKEDLGLDKYGVISTVGYEAGAELYAKDKGIDLFIIRPSIDNDFGYSGRIIKFNLHILGSKPINIKLLGKIIAEPPQIEEVTNYVYNCISKIEIPENDLDLNKDLDLYRFSVNITRSGHHIYSRGAYVNNMVSVIADIWRKNSDIFWDTGTANLNQKILFKEPTALFLSKNIVVIVNEISFEIEILRSESNFEVDRGTKYPLVLENVIEKAITPLRVSLAGELSKFTMCDSEKITNIDLDNKPDNVVGRDGVRLEVRYNLPLTINTSDRESKSYVLTKSTNGYKWKLVSG